ncbi:MAG: InlB B-repeat-containing protein, partial [Oscillospiraceae bacterium]|nr:InlB B-repeat-containing protein [Oscillospiraceae bacterium]
MRKQGLRGVRPLAIVLAVVMIIGLLPMFSSAASSVDVGTFEQLKAALESKDVTDIRLTGDIYVPKKGAEINESKPYLVIEADGHLFTAYESNSRSDTIRLRKYGTLKDITVRNANINVSNYFGLFSIPESSKYSDVNFLFENTNFKGPQLVFAEPGSVTLRNGYFEVAEGHSNTVDELVEATHIRLEGVINIFKDAARGCDELFRVERKEGGITVASGAVVNVSLNQTYNKGKHQGFVHFQKSGAYLRFEADSYFNFIGNGFFQQDKDVVELYIGERAQVYIKTHGNFKNCYGIFNVKGDMTVERDAIVNLIATGNTMGDPVICFDKTSTFTLNSPKEFFVFNSSVKKTNKGLAVGLEGCDKLALTYNDIWTMGYWVFNTFPHTDLPDPTYSWTNPDRSNFSAYVAIKAKKVTDSWIEGYYGSTPWNNTTAALKDVNVIYIGGGTTFYNVDFVTYDGDPVVIPSQIVKEGDRIIKPANPERESYDFTGWFLENGAKWDFDNDMVYDNITLYAGWEPIFYSVVFDSNGGSFVPGQTIRYGNLVEEPDDPELTGGIFDGWYLDGSFAGSAWDFDNDLVYEDIVLYAKWAPMCSITYRPGSTGLGQPADFEYKAGAEHIVKYPAEVGISTRVGWEFIYWSTNEFGSGDIYYPGDVLIVNGIVDLYAVFDDPGGGPNPAPPPPPPPAPAPDPDQAPAPDPD